MFGIGVISRWGYNSNSGQQLLLLKIGVFGIGDRGYREQLFGFGVLTAGHTGVFTRIFPGSISSRPAKSRARRANPNNCSLPDGPARGTARHLALIKKIILGVDTLYYMG